MKVNLQDDIISARSVNNGRGKGMADDEDEDGGKGYTIKNIHKMKSDMLDRQ